MYAQYFKTVEAEIIDNYNSKQNNNTCLNIYGNFNGQVLWHFHEGIGVRVTIGSILTDTRE